MGSIQRFIAAAVIASVFQPFAYGGGFGCQEFQGRIFLMPDLDCNILDFPAIDKQFPDVEFLGFPSCFQGTVTGTLDGQQIEGEAYSGLTALPDILPDDSMLFTAATVIIVRNSENKKIGVLYLRDTGLFDPLFSTTDEQLVVVGGTKKFKKAKGAFIISGNEFLGAPAVGNICVKDDEGDEDDDD